MRDDDADTISPTGFQSVGEILPEVLKQIAQAAAEQQKTAAPSDQSPSRWKRAA